MCVCEENRTAQRKYLFSHALCSACMQGGHMPDSFCGSCKWTRMVFVNDWASVSGVCFIQNLELSFKNQLVRMCSFAGNPPLAAALHVRCRPLAEECSAAVSSLVLPPEHRLLL